MQATNPLKTQYLEWIKNYQYPVVKNKLCNQKWAKDMNRPLNKYMKSKLSHILDKNDNLAGGPDLIPGSGRSPEEGNGNPLQYSYLENPLDRAAW